jgi:hypothetical protein
VRAPFVQPNPVIPLRMTAFITPASSIRGDLATAFDIDEEVVRSGPYLAHYRQLVSRQRGRGDRGDEDVHEEAVQEDEVLLVASRSPVVVPTAAVLDTSQAAPNEGHSLEPEDVGMLDTSLQSTTNAVDGVEAHVDEILQLERSEGSRNKSQQREDQQRAAQMDAAQTHEEQPADDSQNGLQNVRHFVGVGVRDEAGADPDEVGVASMQVPVDNWQRQFELMRRQQEVNIAQRGQAEQANMILYEDDRHLRIEQRHLREEMYRLQGRGR